MRAEWTASGACTSGLTAHPRGATRGASGGAATTSTTSAERSRGCRGANSGLEIWEARSEAGNDRLLRVHVGDRRDADARRLDDVHGVDADAWTDVARRR